MDLTIQHWSLERTKNNVCEKYFPFLLTPAQTRTDISSLWSDGIFRIFKWSQIFDETLDSERGHSRNVKESQTIQK